LNPSGGAGALTAIHDAVTLANWIATLHKPKLADIEVIFAEYQAERLPVAMEAVGTTKLFKSTQGKVKKKAQSYFKVSRPCRSMLSRVFKCMFLISFVCSDRNSPLLLH